MMAERWRDVRSRVVKQRVPKNPNDHRSKTLGWYCPNCDSEWQDAPDVFHNQLADLRAKLQAAREQKREDEDTILYWGRKAEELHKLAARHREALERIATANHVVADYRVPITAAELIALARQALEGGTPYRSFTEAGKRLGSGSLPSNPDEQGSE